MKIKFHKNSIKFLGKCSEKEKSRIIIKIKELISFQEGNSFNLFQELQIKNLEGLWKGFQRIKIGKIRIIFQINKKSDELMIYEIDYRGDVYKK